MKFHWFIEMLTKFHKIRCYYVTFKLFKKATQSQNAKHQKQ